jgi:sn-glycerol 3-phosphate transport system substrate-binding protein
MNQAGTVTYFDKPAVIQALQFWVDLSRKDKIQPEGTIEWGTTPKDFFERKTAIMWTTTGNLTNVRTNAGFPFGVAMLPAHQGRGSPTGGGNFYLFKKMTDEERNAAFKFVKWMTTPERAADWGIATGYIAVRPDAWDTPVMKKYVADFPAAAVARDQLKYAVAELSTHDNQRVSKALNDGIQAALSGRKTPEQAMKDAQQEAVRILRPYQYCCCCRPGCCSSLSRTIPLLRPLSTVSSRHPKAIEVQSSSARTIIRPCSTTQCSGVHWATTSSMRRA